MERQISLSEETQVYLNALLDLEKITSEVYSLVRGKYSNDDRISDPIGEDILTASTEFRKVLNAYLTDNLNTNLTSVSNVTGERAVL